MYLKQFRAGFQKSISSQTPVIYKGLKNKARNYKVYGNSTQAILPDQYQQVEYLESTGTQYIDTEFKPNNNTKIELTTKIISTIGEYTSFYGARTANTEQFYAFINNTSRSFLIRYNTLDSGAITTIQNDTNITIIQDKNKVYINGNLLYTFSTSTFNSPYNMYLFRVNNSNASQYPALIKMYNFKIWDNDVLIRNFIPCIRNSDNVAGMYDTVNQVFYTNAGTGTFTKGPATPTVDTPNEIKSVGDKTANLFNKATAVNGFIITTDGIVTATNYNNKATDYILVNQDIYTISGHSYVQPNVSTVGLAWYDIDKVFISSVAFTSATGNGTYTKSANAVYCRYTVNTTDLNTSQFEAGTSATAYVPFGYKVEVVSRGKNLFKIKDSISTQTLNGVTIKNNGNGTITINGHTNSAFGFDLTDFLYFNPSKTYKISVYKISGTLTNYTNSKNWAIQLQEAYESGTPTFMVNYAIGENGIYPSSTSVPKNIIRKKYRLWFGKDETTTQDNSNFNDLILSFQIEENSISTSFEPYTPPSTTTYYLNEPLRAIEVESTDDYNVVINDKYYVADYIDFARKKVVRNITERIITNDMEINYFNAPNTTIADNNDTSYFSIVGITDMGGTSNYCHFASNKLNKVYTIADAIWKPGDDVSKYEEAMYCYQKSIRIRLNKSRLNEWNNSLTKEQKIQLFRTWLSNNPVTVDYILDTPIEETITAQNLEIKEETTIIESNNEVQPLLYAIDYNSKSNKN